MKSEQQCISYTKGMAKLIFDAAGVKALFYIEQVAWLMAWLFVLVPYYFYQRKLLKLDR